MMNKEAMEKAIGRLTDQNRRFFYKEIKSPDWIPVLIEHEEYKHIPDVKIFEEKKIHPKWPVLAFLSNLSKQHHEDSIEGDIVKFISNINYIQNQSVLYEILVILNNMDLDINHQESIRLLNQILKIDPNEYVFGLINALRVYLKREIKSEEKIFLKNILDNFLSVDSVEKEFKYDKDETIGSIEFETKINNWQFEEIVKEDLYNYVINCFPDGYDYVLNKLDSLLSLDDGAKTDDYSDYSYIWRSALPKSTYSYLPKELIFELLITASFDLIDSNRVGPKTVIQHLLNFKNQWSSLLRLAIYIYDKYFDNVGSEFISNFNVDRLVTDHTIWKEVAFLYENHFGKLSPDTQKIIIKSILNNKTEDEDLNEIQTLRKLQVIERYLKDSEKELLNTLIQKRGRIENPYSHFESGSAWVGPTSPLNFEELKKKSPGEILEYLKSWQPEGKWNSSTPEGLGRLLESYFKENANDFNDKIDELKELDPTYIRSFLSGLTEYNDNNNINWNAILELSLWCCKQDDNNIKRDWKLDSGFDADPNWSWTRKRIASLLEKKLQKDVFNITEKDQIWNILKILVNDPEPSKEYEMTYGGTNMDALTLSLNTVRGKAFHAFFQFFLWLVRRKEINKFSDDESILNVVNEHIHDHSLAVRAVYGFFFPVISRIDIKWSKETGKLIFPSSKDDFNFFIAAYKGLTFNRYIVQIYDDHSHIFDTLLNHIESGNIKIDEYQEICNSLAKQVWLLFLYKKIELNNNSIFLRLINVSNNDLLRSVIGYFYSIYNKISPDLINEKKSAILTLWDIILDSSEQISLDEPIYRHNAISFFGQWLLMSFFEPKEKLERIVKGLNKVPFITPISKILPYLESLSTEGKYASEICSIIFLLVKYDADFSYVQRSESTKTIIKNLSVFDDLKPQIRDLINELIRQEFYDYKDFLV